MEKENDIIYDLDASGEEIQETPEENPQSDQSDESSQLDQLDQSDQLDQLEESSQSDPLEESDQSDQSDQSASSDTSESKEKSPAEAELQKLLDNMGAETLVEIIKDNRNAAIRQIISEMQAAQPKTLRSGVSVNAPCNSIFDLAAMA